MAPWPVKITYEARFTLPLSELLDFQGDAKVITEENLKKLKTSIRKYGFFVPMFVWRRTKTSKAFILDGHQRLKAVKELAEAGANVPELPVEYIHASTRKDAAQKLLAITSQYGQFDYEGLESFVASFDLALPELEDIRLVDTELAFDPPDFDPVSVDEQGRLDELDPKIIICPHCGESFDARKEA